MKFTKMQGLGNDYVYVNCLKETVIHPSEMAIRVSDRHFGIGADGLILIRPSVKADFEMEMYNADGSRGDGKTSSGTAADSDCNRSRRRNQSANTGKWTGISYDRGIDGKSACRGVSGRYKKPGYRKNGSVV